MNRNDILRIVLIVLALSVSVFVANRYWNSRAAYVRGDGLVKDVAVTATVAGGVHVLTNVVGRVAGQFEATRNFWDKWSNANYRLGQHSAKISEQIESINTTIQRFTFVLVFSVIGFCIFMAINYWWGGNRGQNMNDQEGEYNDDAPVVRSRVPSRGL